MTKRLYFYHPFKEEGIISGVTLENYDKDRQYWLNLGRPIKDFNGFWRKIG